MAHTTTLTSARLSALADVQVVEVGVNILLTHKICTMIRLFTGMLHHLAIIIKGLRKAHQEHMFVSRSLICGAHRKAWKDAFYGFVAATLFRAAHLPSARRLPPVRVTLPDRYLSSAHIVPGSSYSTAQHKEAG
jgi:hypothetical protein